MAKYANQNAVTVVRVSGKKQGDADHFGMDAQRTSNARIVAEHGFAVRKTVEYSDVSGDAVMFTKEMQELQDFLRTPRMKDGHLVAKELSRLLRPNFNSYPLLQVFVDQRITIHTPTYDLQLWTPEGRILVGLLCAIDFNEAARIRERCMAGREEARLRGYCAAGSETLPTGFLWDRKTKTVKKDPEYLPNALEAFRMVYEGETTFQIIIDQLHFRLRPPKGRKPKLTTPTGLRRLLSNRLFIGELVWDKKCDMSIPKEQLMYIGKDGKYHKRERPLIARDEVIVRKVMEPVVSREVFDRVQAILQAKSDKTHQSHLLNRDRERCAYRGLTFCADCGQPEYSVFTGAYAYYRCRDYFPKRGGTGKCRSQSMKASVLDAEIDRVLSKEFPRSEFLAKLMKEQGGSENRRAHARRDQLQAKQNALVVKRDRIIDLAVEGRIPKADLDRRLKLVEEHIEANHKALAELVEPTLPTHAEWKALTKPFTQNFCGLPVAAKRRLVASRIQQIKVKDGRVVSWYLLTGEVKAAPVRPEEHCHTCGRVLELDDLDYNRECERDVGCSLPYSLCRACLDRTPARMRAEHPQQRPPVQQVSQEPFADSASRL
jgi:DNA invertase Pin-like site-specific DNA recombinase